MSKMCGKLLRKTGRMVISLAVIIIGLPVALIRDKYGRNNNFAIINLIAIKLSITEVWCFYFYKKEVT